MQSVAVRPGADLPSCCWLCEVAHYFSECSEEYEPDARFNEAATSLDGPEATSLAKLDSEGYDRLVSFVRCVSVSL